MDNELNCRVYVRPSSLVFSKMTTKNKSNEERLLSEIVSEHEVTLLYFCSPLDVECKNFQKLLIRVYRKAKEMNRSMEVVYVPTEINMPESEFMRNFKLFHGPWWFIDMHSVAVTELIYMFSVSSIPTVIALTSKGKIITVTGKQQIEKLGNDILITWF